MNPKINEKTKMTEVDKDDDYSLLNSRDFQVSDSTDGKISKLTPRTKFSYRRRHQPHKNSGELSQAFKIRGHRPSHFNNRMSR